MNAASVLILLTVGGLIGFWLGGTQMVQGIWHLWPDLYEEMRRRSEEDEG